MNTLQVALLGNAIFSLLSGLFLVWLRSKVANWFELEKSLIFLILGIGLLYFSYSIFRQLKTPEEDQVFYIIMQDLIWVFASAAIIIFKPFNISSFGYQAIAGVAVVVLIFGVGQSVGLAQTDDTDRKGIKRLAFERMINVSKQDTWQMISDVGNYHTVAPNIDSVQIVSGQGEGMIRSCTHKADHWTEVATLWEEGEQYSFEVDTEAEDYPYPLKYLKGTWQVKEVGPAQSQITMVFEFAYERRIFNLLIHPFMKKKFDKICSELLDNWQEELEFN